MKEWIYKTRFVKGLIEEKRASVVWQEEELLKKQVLEEVKKIVICILALFFIVLLYVVTYKPHGLQTYETIEKQIEEENYSIDYRIGDSKIKGKTHIIVPEKVYSKKEAQDIFQKVKEQLIVKILGDNTSLDKVSEDLNFVEEIERYPVTISYQSSKEDVVTSEGQVNNYTQEVDNTIVSICALLELGDFTEEYEFHVNVIVPEDKSDTWWNKAVSWIIGKNLIHGEKSNEIKLPKEIGGEKVTFFKEEEKRPWWLLLSVPVVTVILCYGVYEDEKKGRRKKEEILLKDYPELVSRMCLYIQAGMNCKSAIKKIVEDYEIQKKARKGKQKREKFGYEELSKTYYEMKSGSSEHAAYSAMGERIGLVEYRRLTTLLIQQLEKGSKTFLQSLQQETVEAFEKKKRIAKEAGEKAGTKLLLPMGLMLFLTLVIIMVPAIFSFVL